LTMNDYVGDELRLTHDLMALTLGVRRAGVSVAANSFREMGAIDYRRSYINVIDRTSLEAIACECYRVIKEEFDNLFADLSGQA
jgi:Crp-like helix-turn-helix protein